MDAQELRKAITANLTAAGFVTDQKTTDMWLAVCKALSPKFVELPIQESDVSGLVNDLSNKEAVGTAQSVVFHAINGTSGKLAAFSGPPFDPNTLVDAAYYSATPQAGVIPVSDSNGTLNRWVNQWFLCCNRTSSRDIYDYSYNWPYLYSIRKRDFFK